MYNSFCKDCGVFVVSLLARRVQILLIDTDRIKDGRGKRCSCFASQQGAFSSVRWLVVLEMVCDLLHY